jgi:hypothetical protein
MTPPESGPGRRLYLVAVATVLGLAACGHTGGASTGAGQTTAAAPSESASGAGDSPPAAGDGSSAAGDGSSSPSSADVAAGKYACTLVSAGDAAAALGMAVGQGRPSPGVYLSNHAQGGGCQWSDSAGGTAVVVTLTYPTPAIASTVFTSSASGSVPGVTLVHLPPGLAPAEHADTGSFSGTRIAEGFMLDGNRELDVTINEPTSGPGSRFSLTAFVALVQQAAQAWR